MWLIGFVMCTEGQRLLLFGEGHQTEACGGLMVATQVNGSLLALGQGPRSSKGGAGMGTKHYGDFELGVGWPWAGWLCQSQPHPIPLTPME